MRTWSINNPSEYYNSCSTLAGDATPNVHLCRMLWMLCQFACFLLFPKTQPPMMIWLDCTLICEYHITKSFLMVNLLLSPFFAFEFIHFSSYVVSNKVGMNTLTHSPFALALQLPRKHLNLETCGTK